MLAYDEEDYFEIYGCTGACEEDFDEDAEMDKQDENEED
jgi:hypothetical protein